MSLQTVLTRLRSKKANEQLNEWQEYRLKILLPLARNEEIDCDEVDVFLQRLNKSEQDLQDDVAKIQKRLAIKARLEVARENQRRLETIEPQIERLEAEFMQVQREFEAKLSPLRGERKQLQTFPAPQDHEHDLRRSIFDPSLIDALQVNIEKRKGLLPRMEFLRVQLSRNSDSGAPTIRYQINNLEEQLATLGGSSTIRQLGDSLLAHAIGDKSLIEKRGKIAELREQLDGLVATRTRYESELSDLQRQLADLDAEQKNLYERALEP